MKQALDEVDTGVYVCCSFLLNIGTLPQDAAVLICINWIADSNRPRYVDRIFHAEGCTVQTSEQAASRTFELGVLMGHSNSKFRKQRRAVIAKNTIIDDDANIFT